MGEIRKAKRPGPLPMHWAIRFARMDRKFDQLMAGARALEEQTKSMPQFFAPRAKADDFELARARSEARYPEGNPSRTPAAHLQSKNSVAGLLFEVFEVRVQQ